MVIAFQRHISSIRRHKTANLSLMGYNQLVLLTLPKHYLPGLNMAVLQLVSNKTLSLNKMDHSFRYSIY